MPNSLRNNTLALPSMRMPPTERDTWMQYAAMYNHHQCEVTRPYGEATTASNFKAKAPPSVTPAYVLKHPRNTPTNAMVGLKRPLSATSMDNHNQYYGNASHRPQMSPEVRATPAPAPTKSMLPTLSCMLKRDFAQSTCSQPEPQIRILKRQRQDMESATINPSYSHIPSPNMNHRPQMEQRSPPFDRSSSSSQQHHQRPFSGNGWSMNDRNQHVSIRTPAAAAAVHPIAAPSRYEARSAYAADQQDYRHSAREPEPAPPVRSYSARYYPSDRDALDKADDENSLVSDAVSEFGSERSPAKRESITKLLLKSKEFLQAKSLVRNRNNEIDWVATFLNVGFESNSIYALMCPLRKGRWKAEEERYTMELLRLIESGTIRLRHGQSIRGYIAKKLHSDDMRVLKKLSNCRMFHFARMITPRMSEDQELDYSMPTAAADLQRLEKLKGEFLRSVQLEALVAVRKYLSDSSIRELLNGHQY